MNDINIELMNQIRACSNLIKRTKQLKKSLPQGYGRILSAVYSNNGLMQSELAKRLEIRPQSLTRALIDLEERGLVIRNRSQNDRRIITVSLSNQGIEYHKKIEEHRSERARLLFDGLKQQQKEELLVLLKLLLQSNS